MMKPRDAHLAGGESGKSWGRTWGKRHKIAWLTIMLLIEMNILGGIADSRDISQWCWGQAQFTSNYIHYCLATS